MKVRNAPVTGSHLVGLALTKGFLKTADWRSRVNRKLIVLLVAFLTLAPLAAQDSWGAVRRVLQLSADQVQQSQEIWQNCRAQIGPLQRQVRPLRGLLRELSDPTALGDAHLQIRDLNQEIRALQQECRDQFENEILLTQEQKDAYARIREWARSARRYERIIPSFRELGLLGGAR